MKIDLNSPVEVWRIDAPNTGFPSCELTLFNLSGQQVVSVEVTLTVNQGQHIDGEGGLELRLGKQAV